MTSHLNGPGDILPASAAKYPNKRALITATRSLTYTELNELSDRVAAGLIARGVRPGDRVSLYSSNRWEWIVAYHGALKASAVVNPINVMLTAGEVQFVLGDCSASVLFASQDKLASLPALVKDIPSLHHVVGFDSDENASESFAALTAEPLATPFQQSPVNAGDPSTIGYTSGTTGHPKGAVQSQQAVLLNCEATAKMHGRVEADVIVSALPAPHVYGNVVINSTFLSGGTVVLMERFDPARAIELMVQHRATLFEGVPAMYSMLLSHPDLLDADLSSITRSTVGGQTISLSTIEAWQRKTDAPVLELWGMTELAGLGTTHWYDQPPLPGSIGVALPGLELRTGDLEDTTKDAAPGQPGELMARGPHVMLGYFNNADATKEAIDSDGWLRTGDVATVTDDGHYFIVDRRKDMIITAGYNVYPAEIERVIAAHPDVAMVAVGAVPDEVKGELARAYVVLRDGVQPSEQSITAYAREHLAPYKVPRSVKFVSSLPQTSTGKIMRRKLAETSDDQ
jgi:long-chain acyl-CoA synthetase